MHCHKYSHGLVKLVIPNGPAFDTTSQRLVQVDRWKTSDGETGEELSARVEDMRPLMSKPKGFGEMQFFAAFRKKFGWRTEDNIFRDMTLNICRDTHRRRWATGIAVGFLRQKITISKLILKSNNLADSRPSYNCTASTELPADSHPRCSPIAFRNWPESFAVLGWERSILGRSKTAITPHL